MTAYLELVGLDSYLGCLESRQRFTTHIEHGVKTGEFSTQHNIQSVTYLAVFSQRFIEVNAVETIVCCAVLMWQTNSLELRSEQHKKEEEKIATIVNLRFEELKAEVKQRGFKVMPGKWTAEAPSYMLV